MYDKTITLFNYRKSTRTWHTSVFKGVDVIELRSDTSGQHGHVNGDTVDIILHVRADKTATAYDARGGSSLKQYVSPRAYEALVSPDGSFTMTPEVDFIVVGEHDSAIPYNDDDYEGGLYHATNAAMDGVYMVTSATFFSLLPHFEIGGR